MKNLLLMIFSALIFTMCGQEGTTLESKIPAATESSLTRVYSDASIESRDLTFRDTRLLYMKHTDTEFQNIPGYTNRAEWEERAEYLREQILISAGLWPMPEKTDLTPEIFGRVERDDYTIDKVYIQTHPDYYLAGNLYTPKGKTGPFPGILSPHGHWERGRIHDSDLGSIPARAINFAKQGYVTFAYDMVAYGDSRQVSHSFADDSLSHLWGINLYGLQLWNSIRALEFLKSLPDVDTSRIAVTGASGGATQTFSLTAVLNDSTIKVSAPVNMISTVMQGGCWCENAPGLRLNAFNVEFGAMFAPRPLMLVSNTHDWTVHTPHREYPMIQSIYKLYDADDKLTYTYFDYPHNYNESSREAVYQWFGKWLLNDEQPAILREQPFEPLVDSDLLVFLSEAIVDREVTFEDLPAEQYSLPPGAENMNEEKLVQYLKQTSEDQLISHWPVDQSGLQDFRELYGTAYEHIIAAKQPENVDIHLQGKYEGDDWLATNMLISPANQRHWIPSIYYEPQGELRSAVLMLDPNGKSDLVERGENRPIQLVRKLLEQGFAVMTIDVFKTGEHVLIEGTVTQRDENFEYFTTFNKSNTQERVQDILTAITFLESQQLSPEVNLVGYGEAGAWTLLAAGVAENINRVLALDMDFSLSNEKELLDIFVPGFLRIGGFNTTIALASSALTVLSASRIGLDMEGIRNVYDLSGAPDRFQYREERLTEEEILTWLRQ